MMPPAAGVMKKLTIRPSSSVASNRSQVCLVLGGTGLLGNALRGTVESLAQQQGELVWGGYNFVFVGSNDADLRDWHETQKLFRRHCPAAVIHLAAKVGGLYENMRDNEEFLRHNVQININVVAAAMDAKVTRGIFCLSTCAYPESVANLPMNEEDLHRGPAHPSNEGYAAAKRLLEQQIRFARHRLRTLHPDSEFTWISVVPCNLYGPHDNFELNIAHVLPALVHKAAIAKRDGDTLKVRGQGRAVRQFLFSQDAARILVQLLERDIPETHCLMNLCPDAEGSELSIANLAALIMRCTGYDGGISYDQTSPEGVLRKLASNEKLRDIIGHDFRFTPLEEGIQKTVDWFEANMHKARK